MSNIDEMAEKFESIEDLKNYSKAQHNVILKLQKENMELKNKIKELEAKVQIDPEKLNPNDKDSQFICEMEIAKLRNKSLHQELTLEDTRKLEIYTKILSMVKKVKEDAELQSVSESELINIVNYKQ